MRPHFLIPSCVILVLSGACNDRLPLAAGGAGGAPAGAAGVGGGSMGHQSGGGRGGAPSGSAGTSAPSGSAGTSAPSGNAGAGAGGSGGTISGGGTGGTASGIAPCPNSTTSGQPCQTPGASCATGPCEECSDRYWRIGRTILCACQATGSWLCSANTPGGPGGGDCFFDPPLECPLAQWLYTDATCQTHPPCE
jgi:hypothetical protein